MSAEVISMADFKSSAKNLEVEPKEAPENDYEMEMMDAALLMSHIGETTDANIATLYFIWADALDILIQCGWTPEDLHGQVTKAWEARDKEEEEDE